jgi:hypothetical protein
MRMARAVGMLLRWFRGLRMDAPVAGEKPIESPILIDSADGRLRLVAATPEQSGAESAWQPTPGTIASPTAPSGVPRLALTIANQS